MESSRSVPVPSAASRLSRRTVIRRALCLGGGMALGSGVLAACTPASPAAPTAAPAKPTDAPKPAAAATTPPKPAAAEQAPAAKPAATTAAAVPARRGGTLTVGLPADALTFDPFSLSFQHFPLVQNMYDTLIRYDHDLKPLPGLAESWTIAPDGQSVTLQLRKGVKFQSGRELDADAVVKNFEKAADKDRGFNMLPAVANVDGVTALDGSTARIAFKKVSPEITDVLQAMSIVDPSGMDDLKTRAAGSGPFRFVEWAPGDRIVLERNADYWNAPAPYVDRLIYKVFGDSDAMVAALQSGIIDICTSVPPKDVARLGGDFTIVRGYPGALTYELRINPTNPPFDRKEVRQAMQYAIDRQGVVDSVLFGVSQPTVQPFSQASAAHDPSIAARYPFDLNTARELLGGASGLKAEAIFNSQFPELQAIAQVLKADLAKIGFELDLVPLDATQATRRLLAGEFQITPSFSGNTQKYPTRIALNSIYRTANNPVWGDNPPKAYVDALNDANGTIDPARQKEAFAKLNAALLDESWVVNVAYRQSAFGLAKYVKGFDFTVDDMIVLENVSLDR